MIGDTQYKWKAVDGDISDCGGSKKWRCTLLSGDLRDGVSVPSNQGQGRTPIATFTPPQQHLRNAELRIFANLSQQPRNPILPTHGYPVSHSDSTSPSVPSDSALSHSRHPCSSTRGLRLLPWNHAECRAVVQLGGQSRPQATTGARASIDRQPARDRSPVSANLTGYTAPFPTPSAQATRLVTSSLPRENEFSSQNLVRPRRNRGPSDGILTGAIHQSTSERRHPLPIFSPVALEPPPLAMIDGLMTCCILLAAGRLEHRNAQSELPASSSSPSAPLSQGISDGLQLTTNQRRDFEISPQIGLPRHILEIQRQLYESYMAAGSTPTLPVYEVSEENSAEEGFRSIESHPSSLPPSYSIVSRD